MQRETAGGTSTIRKVALTFTAVAAFLAGLPAASQAETTFRASLRRTQGGIPHIRAEDWAGLGYGTGYAVAQDNLCLLARNFLELRAERSRYLGAGLGDENLDSDFFIRLLHQVRVFDDGHFAVIDTQFQDLFRGYAAGYNRYLRDIGGRNKIADPSCRGQAWVREITEYDVLRAQLMPVFIEALSRASWTRSYPKIKSVRPVTSWQASRIWSAGAEKPAVTPSRSGAS